MTPEYGPRTRQEKERCPAYECDSCARLRPRCHVRGMVACGAEGDFCLECRGNTLDEANEAADCCEVWS